jgi:epoxyqueuosine reductase
MTSFSPKPFFIESDISKIAALQSMQIEERLKKQAYDMGADLFGIADLTPAKEAVEAQGGPELAGYPRAISIGIILLDPIVDQLPKRSDRAVSVAYRHYAYDVVNDQLDGISLRLSNGLQR